MMLLFPPSLTFATCVLLRLVPVLPSASSTASAPPRLFSASFTLRCHPSPSKPLQLSRWTPLRRQLLRPPISLLRLSLASSAPSRASPASRRIGSPSFVVSRPSWAPATSMSILLFSKTRLPRVVRLPRPRPILFMTSAAASSPPLLIRLRTPPALRAGVVISASPTPRTRRPRRVARLLPLLVLRLLSLRLPRRLPSSSLLLVLPGRS